MAYQRIYLRKLVPYVGCWVLLSFLLTFDDVVVAAQVSHCEDVFRTIRLPCWCGIDSENGTEVLCDHVSFHGDFPLLPFRAKIHSFTQRHSGVQNIEAQLFTASDIPLKRVDFSHNLLRRLTERVFEGVEDTLEELRFADNRLGDQLNPIFSTNEFRQLEKLKLLDISDNSIKAFDTEIFKGLKSIQELHLENNELEVIPSASLHHLSTLVALHLQNNLFKEVNILPSLPTLEVLNLDDNDISTFQEHAFAGLTNLMKLSLSMNRLKSIPSNAFEGLVNLEVIDLSNNFLTEIPVKPLTTAKRLKRLILHSNKIRSLDGISLEVFEFLEYIDLGRNGILGIPQQVFSGLPSLKELNLGVNVIRKLDDQTFDPDLVKLETLDLSDNQILIFPTDAFIPLKNLRKLNLNYNRIAAISENIVNTIHEVQELSLAFNLIREIPDGTFRNLKLHLLSLHGNKIEIVTDRTISGVQNSLLYLDLGYNEIRHTPKLNCPNLQIMTLARNYLADIHPNVFDGLPQLRHLNLSYNHIQGLLPSVFQNLKYIETLDLSHNYLNTIMSGTFTNLSLVHLSLQGNQLTELPMKSFQNLFRLTHLELQDNHIQIIRNGALDELQNLRYLNLRNNQLTSFGGDMFTVRTKIEKLDLSNNQISYLYPNSFVIHRQLKEVNLGHNKLTFFPSEILNTIRSLQHINIEANKLQTIDNAAFSNMPNLQILELQGNEIRRVEEGAFQNSSQLREICLQHNQISQLENKTFKGINRLNIDLSHNEIMLLPSEVFSRMNVFKLESINFAHNQFHEFPIAPLKRQYSFLEKANFSHNLIKNLPSNADVLVNIKILDLSFNPLTQEAHQVLLAEPKSVRELHLAQTNLRALPIIESPFLKVLNLSSNFISKIHHMTFQKSGLLETLDLSNNSIPNLSINTASVWSKLPSLQELDLSQNPMQYLVKGDLDKLPNLKVLQLHDLPNLDHLDCEMLNELPHLRVLKMYGYPSLNSLDTKSCLDNFKGLQNVAFEVKERQMGDQLQALYTPRLKNIYITGRNLMSLSSSAFAGVQSPYINISLVDTDITNLPLTIFHPLPLSSKITLNIQGSKIKTLGSQLLSNIDSKQTDIKLKGLNSNPITCDCNLQPFWKWLQDKLRNHPESNEFASIMCASPNYLQNRKVKDVLLEELICGERPTTTTTTPPPPPPTTQRTTPYRQEPDIIFEPPSTTPRPHRGITRAEKRNALTKVDTMIIAIVAGVVAFVCILIIIICVIRLRRGGPHYTAGPMTGPLSVRAQGKCTCLVPPPNICTCYPPHSRPLPYLTSTSAGSHLPMKMLPLPPVSAGTLGRPGHLKPPYYVTYPDSDHENR